MVGRAAGSFEKKKEDGVGVGERTRLSDFRSAGLTISGLISVFGFWFLAR